MLDTILGIFNSLWQTIIDFLPGSPFTAFQNVVNDIPYLAEFNWFFPLNEVIGVLEVWLTVIALYYTYMAIMRFIRLI